MDRLVIRLFGEPSFAFDGAPWKFAAPPRCLPLLGLLAINRDTPVTRASLAATMWPDDIDAEARSNLRRHLHRLVQTLPKIDGVEWILGESRTLEWNSRAPASIDVREFEDAVADPARQEEAVELYQGEFLEGVFDEYVLAERERLRAAYLDALGGLARTSRDERKFSAAIAFSEKLLLTDEWREDALRELMAARYESGDKSAALAAYERFSRRLAEEFGSSPMPETIALRDAIRAGIALPQSPQRLIVEHVSHGAERGWHLPFVGRNDDVERLRAAWSRAARKSGGVAFISGDAGIGKSRLASELVAVVRDQGGHALVGSTSNPESEPYQAIASALRSALSHVATLPMEPALLAALAELLPELHSLHPGLPVEELPLERARQRLFEATARAFELLGKQRPLCVVLEDLHWAGPATLALLESLARRVGTLQVLLVATFRTDHGAAAVQTRNLRARLVQERRALAFTLKPLSSGDVRSIVEAAEESSPARGDLASRIATLSEGNPLFVTQLLEGYRETHAIPDESTAIATVNDAILNRMDRLDEQVRSVAETAAIFGESFTADFIAAAGGWPENEVLDAIGELMDRSLVRESGGGALEYTFTHALIARALYRSSSPAVRLARHRRVARVLERHVAEDARRLAEIARHWEMAGEKERASELYLRAAHSAIALYARDEAVARARKALELGLDAKRSFEAYLLASRAQLGSGEPRQWNADIEELEVLAKELGDEYVFAALEERHVFYRQTGEGLLRQGAIQKQLALAEKAFPEKRAAALANLGMSQLATARLEDAVDSMKRALAVVDASDAPTRALAREGLVQALLRLGRREEALAEIDAMRADRAILSTPALRRRLLNAQVSLALATEDMDLAIETGEELLALAEQIGDAFAEMHARQILAYGSQYRSDVHTVRAHMDATIQICERIGAKDNYRALLSDYACFERYLGRADAALQLLDRSLETSNDTFDSTTVAYGVLEKSHVYTLLGRPQEGYEMAQEAVQRGKRIRERRLLAASNAAAGVALTALGRAQEAVEHLASAVEVWREDQMIAPLCNDLCSYANALVAAGRIDDAVEVAAELRALGEKYPRKQWYPSRIHWAMALVARAAGDEPAARRAEMLGRNQLARELSRLEDEEGAAAYAALPFNRALVSA